MSEKMHEALDGGRTAPAPNVVGNSGEAPERFSNSVLVDGELVEVFGRPMSAILKTVSVAEGPEEVVPGLAAVSRVTMMAAREKLGKSTLAASAAVEVSRGGTYLGQPVKAGVVLWVGLEEAVEDALARFVRMGADPENIVLLERLRGDGGFKQLKAEVKAWKPRLVVLDSLAKYAAGVVEDENNAGGWTRELGRIVELARETGAAILILHHSAKSSGSYRGSTAIAANMDMVVEMFEDPKDASVRVMKAKGRWQIDSYAVRYDVKNSAFALASAEDGVGAEVGAKGEARRAEVLAFLADNPGSGKVKLREALGGRAEHVDEAIKALVDAGEILHRGGKAGYVVVDGDPSLLGDQAVEGGAAATDG